MWIDVIFTRAKEDPMLSADECNKFQIMTARRGVRILDSVPELDLQGEIYDGELISVCGSTARLLYVTIWITGGFTWQSTK